MSCQDEEYYYWYHYVNVSMQEASLGKIAHGCISIQSHLHHEGHFPFMCTSCTIAEVTKHTGHSDCFLPI